MIPRMEKMATKKEKQKRIRLIISFVAIFFGASGIGGFFIGEQTQENDNWDGGNYLRVDPGSDVEIVLNTLLNDVNAESIEVYGYNYKVPILEGVWTSDKGSLVDIKPSNRFYSYAEERTIEHLKGFCFNNLEATNLTSLDLSLRQQEISCPIESDLVALPTGFIILKVSKGGRLTKNEVIKVKDLLKDFGQLMNR